MGCDGNQGVVGPFQRAFGDKVPSGIRLSINLQRLPIACSCSDMASGSVAQDLPQAYVRPVETCMEADC